MIVVVVECSGCVEGDCGGDMKWRKGRTDGCGGSALRYLMLQVIYECRLWSKQPHVSYSGD